MNLPATRHARRSRNGLPGLRRVIGAVIGAAIVALLATPALAGSYARGGFTVDLPIYADGSSRIDLDRIAKDHGINSRHYRIRKAVVYANSWGYGSWTALRVGKRNTPEYHFASSYDEQHFDGFEAVRIPVHQRHSRHWSLLVGPYTSVRNVVLHLVPAHYAYDRHHVSSLYLAPRLYWYDSTWHRAPIYSRNGYRGNLHAYNRGLRRGLREGYRGYFHHNPHRRHGHKGRSQRRDHSAAFGYREGYRDGRRQERQADRRDDKRVERRVDRRVERRLERREDQRRAERRADRREDQRRAERRADRREEQRRTERRAERRDRRADDRVASNHRNQRPDNRGREHSAGFGRDQRADSASRGSERRSERRAERRVERETKPRHWRGNRPEDGARRQQWSRERN